MSKYYQEVYQPEEMAALADLLCKLGSDTLRTIAADLLPNIHSDPAFVSTMWALYKIVEEELATRKEPRL